MKKTICAVVAARMTSSRMPGKSMALLAGKPSLSHIIARLRRSSLLDGVVIATTENPSDDPIRECAIREGVDVFSGSEEDVLDRTLKAARSVSADIIVQVTGDCPLIDAAVVDPVISTYLKMKPDYICNRMPETYPNGMDTEVFSTELLAEVAMLTNDPNDREHVSLYIYEHPEHYKLMNIAAPPEHHWPELRLTLDTFEDYGLIRSIYDGLYTANPVFGLSETLQWLRANLYLLDINKGIRQKSARE